MKSFLNTFMISPNVKEQIIKILQNKVTNNIIRCTIIWSCIFNSARESERERFTLHQKSPILVDGRMKFFDFSLSDLRALSSFAISFAFGDKKAQLGSNIFWSLISSMHWVFKLRIIHFVLLRELRKKILSFSTKKTDNPQTWLIADRASVQFELSG